MLTTTGPDNSSFQRSRGLRFIHYLFLRAMKGSRANEGTDVDLNALLLQWLAVASMVASMAPLLWYISVSEYAT